MVEVLEGATDEEVPLTGLTVLTPLPFIGFAGPSSFL